ncbi:MAG: hypothetical protein LBE02_00130 [Spirochaetaceae bacterium]|jgi:hypothetical protein|nr:hypothetical protein [Spirochaetaceae bacterium]
MVFYISFKFGIIREAGPASRAPIRRSSLWKGATNDKKPHTVKEAALALA